LSAELTKTHSFRLFFWVGLIGTGKNTDRNSSRKLLKRRHHVADEDEKNS